MTRYSSLATPSATREHLERYGLVTKHRFGQNFLISDAVIGRILELSGLLDADGDSAQPQILEIGPGIGTLTEALLNAGACVHSVEMDRTLLPALSEYFFEEIEKNQFHLHQADALSLTKEDLRSFFSGEFSLIANLPYNIAATLILKLFEEVSFLKSATVMVQAEVADRISAKTHTKNYGAYTAKLRLFADVCGRFEVSAQNFMPAPRVQSAVVKLVAKTQIDHTFGRAFDRTFAKAACAVIDSAFSQRRKTILNAMKSDLSRLNSRLDEQLKQSHPDLNPKQPPLVSTKELLAAFEGAGISPQARAETCEPEQFLDLMRALFECIGIDL